MGSFHPHVVLRVNAFTRLARRSVHAHAKGPGAANRSEKLEFKIVSAAGTIHQQFARTTRGLARNRNETAERSDPRPPRAHTKSMLTAIQAPSRTKCGGFVKTNPLADEIRANATTPERGSLRKPARKTRPPRSPHSINAATG